MVVRARERKMKVRCENCQARQAVWICRVAVVIDMLWVEQNWYVKLKVWGPETQL